LRDFARVDWVCLSVLSGLHVFADAQNQQGSLVSLGGDGYTVNNRKKLFYRHLFFYLKG